MVRLDAHGKYVRKRLKNTDVLIIDEINSLGLCNRSQGIICSYKKYNLKNLPKVLTQQDPAPESSVYSDYAELQAKHIQMFIKRRDITKNSWPVVRFYNSQVRTIYADCSVYP
ncbi:hypothetical protein GGR58DRAFT_509512 [Xylaria digitata]|nr:hypothetical protein GGR58DRAFT_509512 [Xylaria digitata]